MRLIDLSAHVVSHGPHCLDGVTAAVAVVPLTEMDVEDTYAASRWAPAALR